MSEPLSESLGPPPFRFVPVRDPLEGPAFSTAFKLLVSVLVWGCAAWMLALWREGGFGPGLSGGAAWFLAGQALLLLTWWHILRSRTRLDSQGLQQSWIWDKRMELRELAYGKLIRVPGLDWLIAPRLYVRTLLGKFAVFYVADPALLAESQRLLRELRAFRNF